MFYFGIDWSENHHNLCIQSELGATISELGLKHTLQGFEQLDLERCKLGVPSADCLVAIETATTCWLTICWTGTMSCI